MKIAKNGKSQQKHEKGDSSFKTTLFELFPQIPMSIPEQEWHFWLSDTVIFPITALIVITAFVAHLYAAHFHNYLSSKESPFELEPGDLLYYPIKLSIHSTTLALLSYSIFHISAAITGFIAISGSAHNSSCHTLAFICLESAVFAKCGIYLVFILRLIVAYSNTIYEYDIRYLKMFAFLVILNTIALVFTILFTVECATYVPHNFQRELRAPFFYSFFFHTVLCPHRTVRNKRPKETIFPWEKMVNIGHAP